MPLRFYLLVAVSLLPLALISCDRGAQESNDVENLAATVREFYAAIENDQHGKRAEMFTDSAMMMPNGWTIIRGKDNIHKSVTGYPDHVFRIKELNRLELSVSGDIGYTVNEYYYTFHAKGEEPDWKKTKNIHIWRKQVDGSWKLHVDIWNSSN